MLKSVTSKLLTLKPSITVSWNQAGITHPVSVVGDSSAVTQSVNGTGTWQDSDI